MSDQSEKKAPKTELKDDQYKKLDSLFRFYSSQITAHSNYLIAFAFTSAVYVYQVLSRFFLLTTLPPYVKLFWYDVSLIIIGVLLGLLLLFLVGRLLYYTALSNIVQHFMGVTYDSEYNRKVYQDFLNVELTYFNSYGYKVPNTLLYSIWRKLCYPIDFGLYENHYDEITRMSNMSLFRAYLIALSNLLHSAYRTMLCLKFKRLIAFFF